MHLYRERVFSIEYIYFLCVSLISGPYIFWCKKYKRGSFNQRLFLCVRAFWFISHVCFCSFVWINKCGHRALVAWREKIEWICVSTEYFIYSVRFMGIRRRINHFSFSIETITESEHFKLNHIALCVRWNFLFVNPHTLPLKTSTIAMSIRANVSLKKSQTPTNTILMTHQLQCVDIRSYQPLNYGANEHSLTEQEHAQCTHTHTHKVP